MRLVVQVQTPRDFSVTLWTSFQCRGYIFLFRDAHSILSITDEADDPWDYQGKYVFAGLSKKELDAIIKTKKGRNTEHITGFVKEEDPDEWKMYMNQLYWGEGMTLVNRWRRRGFTSDGEIFPVKTWDLRGAPLILYTFQFEPHVIFDAPGKRPHGRDIKMADTFAEVLNFTLVIKKSPDGEFWGFPDANGSWNGMNGKMQRREGHFGLGYSFLTNNDNRMAAIDFTQFYDCDECYQPQNIGVTLQRHFPVKESFNKVIGMIYDTGLMLKWYMDILSQSKKISSDTGDNEMETTESQSGIPLSLEHLQGIFYILLIGLAISAMVFSLEVFCA